MREHQVVGTEEEKNQLDFPAEIQHHLSSDKILCSLGRCEMTELVHYADPAAGAFAAHVASHFADTVYTEREMHTDVLVVWLPVSFLSDEAFVVLVLPPAEAFAGLLVVDFAVETAA